MLTAVLATYAAVVSTCSLIISYFSYRSGGPRLSGNTELVGEFDVEGPVLSVQVHNRGRGPVTIDHITLSGWGPTSVNRKPVPKIGWSDESVNLQLPVRLEGHSGGRWHSRVPYEVTEWLKRDDLVKLVVMVYLADGRTINLDVDTTDIEELDPDNLPNWEVEPSETLRSGWVLREGESEQE